LVQRPDILSCHTSVPTRPTGAAHLRDGFTRSLLQLMREQAKDLSEDDERHILEAIQDFKAKFPKAKVNKGDEFIFTRTAKGSLQIEFQVSCYAFHSRSY
jgi:hypothetical protein